MGIEFEFFKAGNGDSILVSTYDEDDDGEKEYKTHILIDGGHKSLYTRKLRNLKDNLSKLDLVIMTHLDTDHILGLRDLLQEDVNKIIKDEKYNPFIKEIWFNSFNQTSNDGDKIFYNPFESDNASIIHQIQFNELLAIANNKNKKINYKDYISVDNISTLTIGEIEIILLSPNDKKLEELYKKYKKPLDSQNLSGSSYASDSDYSIKDLAKEPFDKSGDDSVANGSSIAFILVYKDNKGIEQNYLFLADAHIDLINEELEKHTELFNDNGKIEFEFIKLSHHGSKFNINEDFLNFVETDNYVILTDTENHYHPDKETLSKIIVHHKINNKDKANFIFNYSAGTKEKRYDFTKQDIELYQDYFELIYSEKYPMEL